MTFYSLDIRCEESTKSLENTYNTESCHWFTLFDEDFLPFADYSGEFTATFDTIDEDMDVCQDQHVFFASFAHNTPSDGKPLLKSTAVFCELQYYEQAVEATIDALSGELIGIVFHGTQE